MTVNPADPAAGNEMDLIAKHTLSLTPDYVLSWGIWESARELLQNAIDQHSNDPQSKLCFVCDSENDRLTIGATNCALEPRTLLLGMSTKLADRKAIGQFGEGYKLALLVLTRFNYGVTIRTGNEVWKPVFEFSKEYDSSVLTIERYRTEDDAGGVFFDIDGVREVDFAKIIERYLGDIPPNRILYEDFLKGKVFVNGLYVCEVPNLQYGYNFSPDRLKLDRDRGMASTFDITWESSRLWEDNGDDRALYDNLNRGSIDTSFVRLENQNTNTYVVERYLSESPEAVPVSTDAEAQRFQQTGHTIRIVPAPLRDLLRRMHKFVFNREGTPTDRIERFQQQFSHQLGSEGKRELESILIASRRWTGLMETGDEEQPSRPGPENDASRR